MGERRTPHLAVLEETGARAASMTAPPRRGSAAAGLLVAALALTPAVAACGGRVDPVALCTTLWDRNMACLDPAVFDRHVPEEDPGDEHGFAAELCRDPRLQQEAAWSAGCVDLTDCDEFLACFHERTPLEEAGDLLQKLRGR
jgi:hypothetical protein